MNDPGPGAKRRRWWKVLAGVSLALIAAIAAIPWVLATPPAQRLLLARANRALAPGSIAWTSVGFSWFGPTRITDLVLRDAQGDRVVVAPRATSDRTLGRLLFDRPRFGTFVLDRAAFDIERRADGTIDLLETLRPIIRHDRRTNVKIVVDQGRIRFRSPGLAEPLTAERGDLTVHVGPGPRPVTIALDLGKPVSPRRVDGATLALRARIEHWWEREGPPKDVEVTLQGRRWPLALEGAGLGVRGSLDGKLGLTRRSGRWSSTGDVVLEGFEATGPRLAGDRLRLDPVNGSWDLAETAGADSGAGSWEIRRLDLTSPIFALKTSGPLPAPPGTAGGIEGTLDLAALAQQVPHALRLREGITLDRGSARVRAGSRAGAGAGGSTWEVEASVSDLLARDGDRAFTLESPATFTAQVEGRGREWTLRRLAVRTAFLDATGEGNLDDGVTWTARVDLGGFQRQLHDLIDLGTLELAGKGDLSGDYRRKGANFAGRLSASLNDLRIGGLASGPLRRDEVRLEAALDGPAGDNGLPRSWDRLQLGLRTGSIAADLVAAARDKWHEATLNVSGPFTRPERSGRVEARAAARWDETGATIEQARLAIVPDGPGPRGEPITIVAQGRYDRARGELVLTPAPLPAGAGAGANAGAIALALAPDGLRIAGVGRAGALRVDGALDGDLAALGRLVRSWGGVAADNLGGRWSARATLQEVDDGWQVGGKLEIPELILPAVAADRPGSRSGGPVGLTLKASYQPERDRLELAELVLASRYATLEASGLLSELDGARRVDLRGKMTPDWRAINRLLAERVEPGARVTGRPRPIRLQGTLPAGPADDWLKAIDGEIGIDLETADVFGMNLGRTAIVLRARGGRLRIDTIDTSINGGRIHLEPELILDDPAGAWLRLGPESSIVDARINDEVSHRILAFAAPVLDNATRARGRVSVRLEEARFPLGQDNPKGTTVTGAVLFRDAEFVAGPMADQLFDLLGIVDRPTLKLNKPVGLSIADRRVYQRGLVIPVGQFTEISMDGWVDFDRNLAMKASLPLTPTMLRDRPLLGDTLTGLRITVPIGGTLEKPEVDRDAFNLAIKDLAKSLLERTVTRGVPNLIDFFTRRRDPDAAPPPPVTPVPRRRRLP